MHLSECYRLLGVPRNATLDDIKVAYRRLARKYHPDVNQNDPTATDKFRLVQEAYKMLKDSDEKDLSKEIFSKNASTNSSTNASTNAVRSPAAPPPPKAPTPKKPPQPHPKIKIEVKQVNNQIDPINSDPELRLKLDMLRRVQDLLKQKKYIVAIAVVEGMSERFPNAPEVVHWKAVTYHRWSSELILAGKLREAEIYLNKALNTDPKNRELIFEVKRDLERVQNLKNG
ncbi:MULTISPECIES: J domain-containing protein [Pseudanabaena]|uniref:Heat shock protein DnaJ domain protein n=2 Tax=Pseudanabaena TaxID=1152 RepID=L8MRU7_9CYAN|nr:MULTISPECIES: J domain-containing protein [Pseudanabaena]ELS30637.1 heat shock protein DnaJ domain protein [Pseudanabaena biceps PCC 7429]MDG3497095.1 J domain-containing protein [Pseudanabaena catenata USMAC16]